MENVYIDCITGSLTSVMSSEQWARLMLGDESYAESKACHVCRACTTTGPYDTEMTRKGTVTMARRTRRNHGAAFKAKVGVEAIRSESGIRTILDMTEKMRGR